MLTWRQSQAVFDTHSLPSIAYRKEGEINLGVLLTVNEFSREKPCGYKISIPRFMLVESIAYSVKKINENPNILPNHTLGFTLLDDCNKAATSLTQAAKFVPLMSCLKDTCPMNDTGRPHYDVVGVVGPTTSSKSALVSPLFSQHKIPHLTFATSADFSNKEVYKYFSRILPPDQYQAKAIMDLIDRYNWTYMSLVYIEGSYGQTLKKQIQVAAKKKEICISYTKEVAQGSSDEDFEMIVRNLLKHKKAKVVVLILNYYIQFLKAIAKLDAVGKFVFIGSESFDLRTLKELKHAAMGTFSYMIPLSRSIGFEDFYLNRKPEDNDENPWIHQFWQEIFDCTWGKGGNGTVKSCTQHQSVQEYSKFFIRGDVSVFIDAVLVFAKAIHQILTGDCGQIVNVTVKDLLAHTDTLLSCMRNVSFQGESGPVLFDKKGDLIGSYWIKQVVASGDDYEHITIGDWVRDVGFTRFNDTLVQWHPGQLNRTDDTTGEIPESVCAKPCKEGEFYIQGELTCCWECRRCRSNDYVRKDRKGCDTCPLNTWPNQTDFLSCLDIPASYLRLNDDYGLALALIASVGLLCTVAAIIFFICKRNHKAIRGAQIELMVFVYIGLVSAFVGSILFAVRPDDDICICTYVIYNLSLILLFAPLLVKCLRIHRLFRAAEKCRRDVKWVGPASITIQTCVLIILKVRMWRVN